MKVENILQKLLTLSILTAPSFVLADHEVTVVKHLKHEYPEWYPRSIVDVGANEGNWTRKVLKHHYNDHSIPVFMVEASPEHEHELEDVKKTFPNNNIEYKIAVLSGKDGDKVEFFGGGGTGDSMFREQTEYYKDMKPIVRETSKLDTLVRHMEHIDYLKLDVQGAELLVLQGATETLNRTTFVQFEVSVVEYNAGGACWWELDDLLRKHGFFLYDLADFQLHPGLLHTKGVGQFDVLYIKPTSPQMPKWLQEANVKFCGSKRQKPSSLTSSLALTLGLDSKGMSMAGVGATYPPSLYFIGFLFTFLCGYFIGRSNRFRQHGKNQ